jgi:hypothetical protein
MRIAQFQRGVGTFIESAMLTRSSACQYLRARQITNVAVISAPVSAVGHNAQVFERRRVAQVCRDGEAPKFSNDVELPNFAAASTRPSFRTTSSCPSLPRRRRAQVFERRRAAQVCRDVEQGWQVPSTYLLA